MMRKKGVELSMNVIIIAAIGLLVLVILAVLVINSTNKVPGTMKSCALLGGVCQSGSCGDGYEPELNGKCTDPLRQNCCKVILVPDQP